MVFQPLVDTLQVRTWYLVTLGCGLPGIFLALTYVLLLLCVVGFMFFTCHIHRSISYPPIHHTKFCQDADRLTMKCWWWVVVKVRLTSPCTNRNPLTHQPTPTYLQPPSHHTYKVSALTRIAQQWNGWNGGGGLLSGLLRSIKTALRKPCGAEPAKSIF